MEKYKLRFNLGAGKNYKKWKITGPGKNTRYVEPTEVTIIMEGCKLVNQRGTATKIYEGAHKTVCAWVEASSLIVYYKMPSDFMKVGSKVSYNPRIAPNWIYNNINADKQEFNDLVTQDDAIYLPLDA